MPEYHDIALIQLIATGFLTGLIWFVQVVHYPLLRHVGPDHVLEYEKKHIRRTTWVVAPTMLIEAGAAGWLTYSAFHAGVARGVLIHSVAMALLLGIWLSTAIVQVPCLRRLENGYDERVIDQLVMSNWLRTFLWTARLVLAVRMLENG